MRELIGLGVDGIITNYPERLVARRLEMSGPFKQPCSVRLGGLPFTDRPEPRGLFLPPSRAADEQNSLSGRDLSFLLPRQISTQSHQFRIRSPRALSPSSVVWPAASIYSGAADGNRGRAASVSCSARAPAGSSCLGGPAMAACGEQVAEVVAKHFAFLREAELQESEEVRFVFLGDI